MEYSNFISEAPTKGVATETMGLVNSGALVKRIYEGASPFAFVREFIQNALDANATRIEIGPDFVGLKTALDMGEPPVYKLMFSDNGDGIPRSKMKTLLNNLSSSGRSMAADANFGIGAKVAALPWNPYGIVFMSWTDKEEGMVRLFRRSDGNYGLFRYDESDETLDRFVDLTTPPEAYRQNWQKASGTSVVLLGSDQNEDTIFGPPSQQAGIYALMQLVNDRYFKFPEGVEVWVTQFETVTKSKWPKNKSEAKRLKANGSFHFLDKYSDDCGTVKIDGAKIHWWWHSNWSNDSTNANPVVSNPGYVGTLYNNELYDVVRRQKYSREKSKSNLGLLAMYAKFGILWQEVWKNVTILVEPDQYSDKHPEGVMPDLARGRLKMANGDDLPWDEWGKAFADKMPEVIVNALDKAADGNVVEINIEAKMKEFFMRMDMYTGLDDHAPKNRGPVPKRRKARGSSGDSDDKSADDKVKPTKYNLPAIEWVKPKTLNTTDDLFNGKAVFYSEANNSLMFNEDFPLWKCMVEHWVSQYPKSIPGLSSKVRDAVRYVYSTAVVSRVVHVRRLRGHRDWGSGAVSVALSNESLTMAVLGIQDADVRIANHLKGTVRTKRNQEVPLPGY